MIFGREPAVFIGIIGSCVVAVATVLGGAELLSTDVVATIGKAIDPTQGGWLIPLIVGVVTRFFVYSPATYAAK